MNLAKWQKKNTTSYPHKTLHFDRTNNTMEDVSSGQHKKKLDNTIIALKLQLLGVFLCFFMHLKWPFLFRFFG